MRKRNRFTSWSDKKRKWFKKGFSLLNEIRKKQKVFIEIGGPTIDGFELIDFFDFDKKVFISNITCGNPFYDFETAEFVGYRDRDKIDFLADGRNLPFVDKSVSVFFISCLPAKIRKEILIEVARVLEDGGLIIWQGGIEKNRKLAEKLGFGIVAYTSLYNKADKKYFHRDVVFSKKKNK